MGRRSQAKKRQKKRQIFETQVKPGLERTLEKIGQERTRTFTPSPNVIDPIAEAALDRFKLKVAKLQARLVSPDDVKRLGEQAKLDTLTVGLPTAYYVIVGRGAAAVVNHTTLLQSELGRDRIGDLPVMHVGFDDPWSHYHEHGMGQPPYLLAMPGYHEPVAPDAKVIRSGCSSLVFARSTQAELERIERRFPYFVLDAWVALIDVRTEPRVTQEKIDELKALGVHADTLETVATRRYRDQYPPYRLLVVEPDGKPRWVYAAKIDICTGAGQMNMTAFNQPKDLLDAARTKPWMPSYRWDEALRTRKVIHGMDGLTSRTKWVSNSRVCVYGGGGIGLNQIERAEDDQSIWMDWLPRRTLHDAFGLERNDTVLKHPHLDRPMKPGESTARVDGNVELYPARARWRFGKNAAVNKIEKEDRRLAVTVAANVNARVGYHDRTLTALHADGYFEYPVGSAIAGDAARIYDRVILCNGQVNNVTGTASKLIGKPFAAVAKDGRLVAAAAFKGDIRVLGAALAALPDMVGDEKDEMDTYRLSLPVSAVLPGFILAGSNIAHANGFFGDEPNDNVNTATEVEITALLTPKLNVADPAVVAAAVIKGRKPPHNGFRDYAQLVNRVGNELAMTKEIREALALLRFGYRDAAF